MSENFFVDTNRELVEKVRERLVFHLGGQFSPIVVPGALEAILRRVRGYVETGVREAELPATDFAVAGYRVARELEPFVSREIALRAIAAALLPTPSEPVVDNKSEPTPTPPPAPSSETKATPVETKSPAAETAPPSDETNAPAAETPATAPVPPSDGA